MANVIKIKNATVSDGTWLGQTIAAGEYYTLKHKKYASWRDSDVVFDEIGTGNLVVNNGTDDLSATEGWAWLIGDTSPVSEVGKKLWVHQSSKPELEGRKFHTVWTGAGDDKDLDLVGGGQDLLFDITASDAIVTRDVQFDTPDQGQVYVHEGYFMWEGAPWGANINIHVMCSPTVMQTSVNLDYNLVAETQNGGNKITYAGPGAGTHGFASAEVYIVPNWDKTGTWDYTEAGGLVPNFTADGEFDIFDVEARVLNFIHRVPVYGNATGFNRLQSSDTARLLPGFFLRATINSDSATAWKCWMFMTLHRERTF